MSRESQPGKCREKRENGEGFGVTGAGKAGKHPMGFPVFPVSRSFPLTTSGWCQDGPTGCGLEVAA